MRVVLAVIGALLAAHSVAEAAKKNEKETVNRLKTGDCEHG